MTTAPSLPARLVTPRMAVAAVFFGFGVTIGLWGGSVAEVARRTAIAPEVVGSAFVGYNAAGILGMAVIGRIGRSISLKARLLTLLATAAICLVLLFQVTTAAGLIAGLFIFSFVSSSLDLVMNSEGLAVERDLGFPVLAGFHGLASLGVGAGAISGSWLSVNFGLSLTAAAGVGIYAMAIAVVLAGTPDRGATHTADAGSTWFRPGAAFIVLGLILGACVSAEIASTMFSAQTLAAQAPHLAAYAGAGATAFALCQAVVRLGGDRLRAAFGDDKLIRLSLATMLGGLAIVTVSGSFALSALGFAVIGIGSACIVPCGFALAVRMVAVPAAAVISMVAIISSVLRIPSPLAYGVAAEHVGFAAAFGIYAAIVALAFVGALAADARTRIRRPA